MTQTVLLGNEIELAYGKGLSQGSRIPGKFPVFGSNGPVGTHEKPLIKGPGIIVGRKGSAGEVIWTDDDFWPIDTTYYVNIKNKDDSLKYWYYQLKTLGLNQLNSHSAIPGLNRDVAYSKNVIKRTPEEQKKIADILGTIDEKIELNRKMNETLEQMGRALFRHYFVDNPNVKKVPIGELVNETNTKVGQSGQDEFTVLSAVKSGELVASSEFFTKQVFSKNIAKYKRVKENEFAYNPARVNIGSIGMLAHDIEGAVSPVYVSFRAKSGYHYAINELLKLSMTKKRIADLCSGTVRQILRFSDFCRVFAYEVDDATLKVFNEQYGSVLENEEHIRQEIQTLTTLRDTLLPRLINGKMKV